MIFTVDTLYGFPKKISRISLKDTQAHGEQISLKFLLYKCQSNFLLLEAIQPNFHQPICYICSTWMRGAGPRAFSVNMRTRCDSERPAAKSVLCGASEPSTVFSATVCGAMLAFVVCPQTISELHVIRCKKMKKGMFQSLVLFHLLDCKFIPQLLWIRSQMLDGIAVARWQNFGYHSSEPDSG